MALIEKLLDAETIAFISKKVQLYTLFSIAMEMVSQGHDFDDNLRYRFVRFCAVYSKFKNEFVFENRSEASMALYDKIKQYKLASSEGVNKVKNRMIRYNILTEFIFSVSFDEDSLCEIEDFFDDERKRTKFSPLETETE